ncbi:DJ-1/PfpI family protein [Actinoplanes hulinensis]|uniref:DJ-1/PfpI family protein n=1 Tax=Actinoplanes hulinensis TaxID=1144547 RepID=A0ABS7AZ08_9ACTN|nr:helix-turn-helix domain-containing protein [Actinoplanes hulinensis]MBW6433789.1 DJ-1/PfpI family protein [Actinoplanes hulinensis]
MREESAIHRVAVLALPPVVAFDAAIATQVFGHEGHGRYEAVLCSLRAGPVPTTTPGFGITVAAGLEAVAAADTVIVPGFRRGPAPAAALDALRAAHQRGARIVSICSGAFALAQAGLLDGRRATTHWAHAGDLAREHPAVYVDPAVLYVDEGTVLTSAGLAAGLDLCLYLIGLDHGQSAAIQRARHMVTALHRAGGQAQYSLAGATAAGERLTSVTQWALANLHQPITVADLARQAMQSTRTLSRAFATELGTSPRAWLIAARLREACTLLETGDLTVEEIARRTGLGSAANLRLQFRRTYATTPLAYRSAFQRR